MATPSTYITTFPGFDAAQTTHVTPRVALRVPLPSIAVRLAQTLFVTPTKWFLDGWAQASVREQQFRATQDQALSRYLHLW